MRLFNEAYSLMLVMMKSFFGTYSGIYQPEPRPQAAMYYAAFFPLMTMVIRPLGEIIARLPANGEKPVPGVGPPRAGASFEIDPAVVEAGVDPRIKVVLDPDYYRDALRRQAAQAKELIDEVPPNQRDDVSAEHDFDYVASDMLDLASQLGC